MWGLKPDLKLTLRRGPRGCWQRAQTWSGDASARGRGAREQHPLPAQRAACAGRHPPCSQRRAEERAIVGLPALLQPLARQHAVEELMGA